MSFKLIPIRQSLLEPKLGQTFTFLQFTGSPHAHRPAMNWTTESCNSKWICFSWRLIFGVLWEGVSNIFKAPYFKVFAVLWLHKLVSGKQREGSLAPILVNISLHGVASLPAVLHCVWVPVAKYALHEVKQHVFGKQKIRSVSGWCLILCTSVCPTQAEKHTHYVPNESLE